MVVLTLDAEDAVVSAGDGGISAAHGVDELVVHPLPGETPIIEPTKRGVVGDGDKGEVAGGEGLDNIVGDGQIARTARKKGFGDRGVVKGGGGIIKGGIKNAARGDRGGGIEGEIRGRAAIRRVREGEIKR